MYGHNQGQRSKGGTSRNVESQTAVIDAAVKKAHSDLLATGESVTAWRVSQAALVMLKADSFESLGCHMQNVPSLYQIIITEAKVNSFINCFVAVQKITSLHDLVLAICENEGITSFEELELGPILKHPLVVYYFSVGPDVTEICKITAEQIVAYLSIIPRKQKKITVDDLLEFIAKKMKKNRENLCIRIQSLGMHIGCIIRGRRSEGNVLKKCSDGSLINDNEEDDGDTANDAANNKNDDAQAASISDPSAAAASQVSETSYCTKYAIHKTPKKWIAGMKFKPELFSMDVETGYIDGNSVDGHTWRFIKIWKESCEDENVVEAYDKMLDFYHGQMKPKMKTKAVNRMISSYPYVGLLNVAIASIKFGLWDRMSSIPDEIKKVGHANTNSTTCAADVKTDVEPAKHDVLVASKHDSKGSAGIILEDVLRFAKEYFLVSNHVLDNISSYPKKHLVLLREICKLESSLTQHFSVEDFATLGFGDIFTFLGEHISLLPTTWQDCFTATDKVEKPSVKVCMSQRYLLEFLSEAANSLRECETLSNLMVSQLLKTQFPSAGLTLLEDEFTADLLANLSKNGDHVSSSIVLFSSTLSDTRAEKGFSDTHVSTNDAVELLLKAPMLVDLSLWSCWDYKFAPSLGPLVGWLLSNVTTKELLCLVTKDGKVLRLDHSATADSFLESFLHGSVRKW